MTNDRRSIISFIADIKGNLDPVLGLMALPLLAIMGLIAPPMLAITGGAIDISHAISIRKELQDALDASALAACNATTTGETPEGILRAYLGAQLAGSQLTLKAAAGTDQEQQLSDPYDVQVENAGFDQAYDGINPTLRTKVPTNLLKLIHINEIDVAVSTDVKCGAKRLELSLVLDVTGSMNDRVGGRRKIASLKYAVEDFLELLQHSMRGGATRIALVPFAAAVNAGRYADEVRGTTRSGTRRQVGHKKIRFRNSNGRWSEWNDTTCVSERLGPDAYKNTAPNCSGSSCSAPVGHVYTNDGRCNPESVIVPLTNDRETLLHAIQNLQPDGYTAGHIGAAWGWYVLSHNWATIFPEASQPEAPNPKELIKATIIVTDGAFNTEYYNGVQDRSTYASASNGTSQSQFARICKAMKDPNGDGGYDDDASVIVYTIGYGLNENGTTARRLKDCATDDTKSFFPYDGDKLRVAFVSIGNQLSRGQAGLAILKE